MAQPEQAKQPTTARPVMHSASRKYIEEEARRMGLRREKTEHETKLAQDARRTNPLRSFEDEAPQAKTDLFHWPTYPEAEKKKKLEAIMAIAMNPPEGEHETERLARKVSAWRTLSYIIWLETNPTRAGSQSIAEAAFIGLRKIA